LSANAPNTKGYAKALKEHVEQQHGQWLEAQAAKQAKSDTKSKTPTTPEGVKKNAYYYKKLKEQVLNHPKHNDTAYTMLKNAGNSNEAILKMYNAG